MAHMQPNLLISVKDIAEFLNVPADMVHQAIESMSIKTKGRGGRPHLNPDDARRICSHFGRNYGAKVLSVQMLKGGVAKTTTVLNLGLRARMYGARVLLVDLDQQGNLTYAMGCEDSDKPVWVDVVENRAKIEDAIIPIEEGLHLISSNLDNSVLERLLTTGSRNIAVAVAQYLRHIKDRYDMIVIDTAPNLSAINTAVTCASDAILLPVNPDRFSFQGLQMTMDELDRIQEEFMTSVETKIVFTRYDGRESASKEFLKACYQSYKSKMLNSFIRTSSDVKNSIRSGKTVFDNQCNAREDYDLLTREVLGGLMIELPVEGGHA